MATFLLTIRGDHPGTFSSLSGNGNGADAVGQTDQGDNDGELDFTDTRRDFPCYANGTLILTPQGPRPVQDLVAGDRVRDIAGQDHAILWSASRHIALDGADHPQRQVVFRPGSRRSGSPPGPAATLWCRRSTGC